MIIVKVVGNCDVTEQSIINLVRFSTYLLLKGNPSSITPSNKTTRNGLFMAKHSIFWYFSYKIITDTILFNRALIRY